MSFFFSSPTNSITRWRSVIVWRCCRVSSSEHRLLQQQHFLGAQLRRAAPRGGERAQVPTSAGQNAGNASAAESKDATGLAAQRLVAQFNLLLVTRQWCLCSKQFWQLCRLVPHAIVHWWFVAFRQRTRRGEKTEILKNILLSLVKLDFFISVKWA